MQQPRFVLDYQRQARFLLKSRAVYEPSFSRGTYQVEVVERKNTFFPFLQLADDGQVTDAFCTCKLSEKGGGCPHLAAAYLRIYNQTDEPLHVRFKQSLWNRLFQIASKRHGYETSCLKKEDEGQYSCASQTNKILFSIQALTAASIQRLEYIVSERIVETEETSIKFSNLSPEQILQWREGKATHTLQYELSFWSDLAKWLMWLSDDGESYEITFQTLENQVPHEIAIRFDDLIVSFYVADVSWPWLIPSLATVASPLKVFDEIPEQKKEIHYDPIERSLIVQSISEPVESAPPITGIPIGDWIYVAEKGFYRLKTDPLLGSKEVKGEEIGRLLTRSARILQPWLDVPIHLDSVPAHYLLHFDEMGSLHIQLYVFEPHDLTQPGAACFFPWVFLPAPPACYGFWSLEELMFDVFEKIISRDLVADFIDRHRHWLHQFSGFQIHLGSLEAHLIYSFTDDEGLAFDARIDFPEQLEEMIDLDEWVYIKGQGFYMKKQNRGRLPLHPGLVVPKEEIGSFLAAHKEDLEQVHGFFAPSSPVVRIGLAIQVTQEGRIVIEPRREYVPGIDPSHVHFYGDFAYVKEVGFSELPSAARLPERYRSGMMIPQHQEAAFLIYDLEPLKVFALEIDPRLIRPQQLRLKIRKISRDRKKHIAEWLIDAIYVSETGSVDLFAIWDGFQSKKNHLFTSAGLISLKEMRFNWLRQIPKRRIDRKRGVIRLNILEWIRLSVFEEIRPPEGEEVDVKETRSLLEELNRFESHRFLDISRLKSTLRPYQELGVQWLWFLYCHGLSGLLCDDMGLGKTHQAMALLSGALHEDPERSFKYLVVCPTSVIYHWQELLQRFLPDLRVSVFYGLTRSLEHFEQSYDLLLTSYGILRSGSDDLRTLSFEIAIFDEIQIAKNHNSQTHQALRKISSRMRLGLTGTPIENRLRELKSLFDVVLPSYLPPDAVFRELFTNPIEKNQDPEKKALLTRLIKPFILRRKKSEVLTDLPEKIEEISYCDLSEEQRELYRGVAQHLRNTVYQELKDETKPVSYVHVFSALSSLKQICDHPSLRLGDIKDYSAHASGKWDLFVELLNEAQDSGQKIVVFSQYLDMLAIIEMYLKKKGIGFASIKGSTRDRPEQLRRFRENPDCEVFVASLLAAGIGIDLTVASIVIHYDRWWNPAKENQATDRVHRIGQNRGVQVFKLVTKNTIEEHIHAIIERKKGLLEELIGQDDADQISYLNREELLAVFETIWKDVGVQG
jgi:superfamily II DNA or RNA helicase